MKGKGVAQHCRSVYYWEQKDRGLAPEISWEILKYAESTHAAARSATYGSQRNSPYCKPRTPDYLIKEVNSWLDAHRRESGASPVWSPTKHQYIIGIEGGCNITLRHQELRTKPEKEIIHGAAKSKRMSSEPNELATAKRRSSLRGVSTYEVQI